jgi:glycosyltransferase involved in cell wall biosynthesis
VVRVRLMVVGRTYVERANRAKWLALLRVDPQADVLVVAPRTWTDPDLAQRLSPPPEASGRFRYEPVDTYRLGGRYAFAPAALARCWRAFRPDLVHVEEEPWSATALQVAALRRWLTPRARMSIFSWWNTRAWSTALRFPGSWSYAAGLRAADLLVAGNHGAERLHREHGYRGPIEIIPQLGVDRDLCHPGLRDPDLVRAHELAGSFVIGYLGRLIREKGVAVLLEAAAALAANPSWTALIVGSGPARAELESLARGRGIEERVRFVDGVPRQDVARYLRLMDVLVLPSLEEWCEQFGFVLVEAMACGVPVVGSTSGEIPWVIGDEHQLFPAGDAAALSSRLRQMMNDPAFAAACRERGIERVDERFTADVIARALQRAFARLDVGAGRQVPVSA